MKQTAQSPHAYTAMDCDPFTGKPRIVEIACNEFECAVQRIRKLILFLLGAKFMQKLKEQTGKGGFVH